MRIKILQFKVQERYVLRDTLLNKIWHFLFSKIEPDQYHFDVVMKVDPEYQETARELQQHDFVELPNKVRLQIWSVDRFGIVKAKTYKFIREDLRTYHPMEMYLVYPRVHGHLKDRVG